MVSSTTAEIQQDTEITYRLKLRGIPLKWVSRITSWDPPHHFVDEQITGPYRLWQATRARVLQADVWLQPTDPARPWRHTNSRVLPTSAQRGPPSKPQQSTPGQCSCSRQSRSAASGISGFLDVEWLNIKKNFIYLRNNDHF